MKLKIFSHLYSSVAKMVSKVEDESIYDVPEAVSPGFSIVLVVAVFLVVLVFSVAGPLRRLFKG